MDRPQEGLGRSIFVSFHLYLSNLAIFAGKNLSYKSKGPFVSLCFCILKKYHAAKREVVVAVVPFTAGL